jgi:DNA-binding protein HU-beta
LSFAEKHCRIDREIRRKGEDEMKKAEFIEVAALKAGLSKKDTQKALDAILDTIQDAMVAGKSVNFIGFGSFTTSVRAARKAKVPGTDRVVDVPATQSVKFKPGKQLKDSVVRD